MQKPKGYSISLVAAEPMLANPVAFDIADDGRIYVVETHRLRQGVIDMRDYTGWVHEDLACLTVEDRRRAIFRHFGGELANWRSAHERIRCLIDDDRDGKVDRATTFADGFNDLVDGIAAGVFAHGKDVWFTDIPNVWRLTDDDGDGVADRRKVLHEGYGVHFSLIGHDLHGAILGPDRRLYFSIGDRGFHVEHEGLTHAYPHEGAVLRCELDGSGLQVVHRGLRNPQELAFDDFGDLFTGDNNSDGGDAARLVQIVEGGDSGWTIGYQWLRTRGAWNEDLLWKPRFDDQPAWINPPIANIGHGPSGIAMHPGTGLGAGQEGRLFWCDFRGSIPHSNILSIGLERDGAGFRTTGVETLLGRICATDCDFGPDGGLYVLDWVNGWGKTGKGRVYRLASDDLASDAATTETARLLGSNLESGSIDDLVTLLGHPDRRVRTRAHFGLVDKGPDGAAAMLEVARRGSTLLARVHAIFGLGVYGRTRDPGVGPQLEKLLLDSNDEIRAQTMRALLELPNETLRQSAERLLRDPAPRVRYFAALAMGRTRDPLAIAALFELLRRNADKDVNIRHAAVVALAELRAESRATYNRTDPSVAVRRGTVLMLRRRASADIAIYLRDPEPSIAAEAIRAIHDRRIGGALEALAAMSDDPTLPGAALTRRILGAHRILGTTTNLRALLRFAERSDAPAAMRSEALEIVTEWLTPNGQDRVLGEWRPLPQRSWIFARQALAPTLEALTKDPATPKDVMLAALRAVTELKATGTEASLQSMIADSARDEAVRGAALEALRRVASPEMLVSICKSISPKAPLAMRRVAREVLAEREPSAVVPLLRALMNDGSIPERRSAAEALSRAATAEADEALAELVESARERVLPGEIVLDVLDAGRAAAGPLTKAAIAAYDSDLSRSQDPLGRFWVASSGGDAAVGEKLFREHPAAQCLRCHAIGGTGGAAGPALDKVGSRLERTQLLRSMIAPSAELAAGYAQVALRLRDGTSMVGVLVREDARTTVLRDANEKEVSVATADIVERSSGGSAMPPMGDLLSLRELRDLVEYLASKR
ncbi:MAG: PVC-type heme-binding CxxCH protein [Planctomycetota bacterium]